MASLVLGRDLPGAVWKLPRRIGEYGAELFSYFAQIGLRFAPKRLADNIKSPSYYKPKVSIGAFSLRAFEQVSHRSLLNVTSEKLTVARYGGHICNVEN